MISIVRYTNSKSQVVGGDQKPTEYGSTLNDLTHPLSQIFGYVIGHRSVAFPDFNAVWALNILVLSHNALIMHGHVNCRVPHDAATNVDQQ